MIRFINKHTGGEMLVADDRIEEYKAAGHRLTAEVSAAKAAAAQKRAQKRSRAKK